MELGLSRVQNGEEEIKSANHPEIRIFKVPSHVAYAPADTVPGSWKICSSQTAGENGGISGMAYFFARKIQEENHVPVGIIVDCLGGTPAESWMTPETLRPLKDFDQPLDEVERLHKKAVQNTAVFSCTGWTKTTRETIYGRRRISMIQNGKPSRFPAVLPNLASLTRGICWFRREITLPHPLPAGKAVLHLGVVDKMDTAYLNGRWVGASSWVENPRAYQIGDGILKAGTNILAVRVFKNKATGGFMSKAGDLNLTLGDQKIPLAGEWRGASSADCHPPHPLPLTYENYPTMSSVLFNGMIAPRRIRGVIWYQGEANFTRAHQYRTLLPLMIGDWRKIFAQGDFPFYIVSLPKFMAHKNALGDDAWAEMREAQALTASSVKNCALAVTVDTGEADNIHPKDKQTVGERLALCALANEYGEKVSFAGPAFVSAEKISGAMRLKFSNTDGGLAVKGDTLGEFSVAGADHKWHWADAKIDGATVVVSSKEVAEPVAARYAWQANPQATLFNGAGLPAAPFRTDDWLGATDNAKPW